MKNGVCEDGVDRSHDVGTWTNTNDPDILCGSKTWREFLKSD